MPTFEASSRGAPDALNTLTAMVGNILTDRLSLGGHQLPYVAAAVLAGGNVRVGLEDNLYLERGLLATRHSW